MSRSSFKVDVYGHPLPRGILEFSVRNPARERVCLATLSSEWSGPKKKANVSKGNEYFWKNCFMHTFRWYHWHPLDPRVAAPASAAPRAFSLTLREQRV